MGEVWQEGWEERVLERVRGRGHSGVVEYLKSRPAVPYPALVDELGAGVAVSQLVQCQMKESKRLGIVRWAAMDSLIRCLRRYLPKGWTQFPGKPSDKETAMAYSSWGACVKSYGAMTSLAETLEKTWASLESMTPPIGWQPGNSEDSFLRKAFAASWPEDQ